MKIAALLLTLAICISLFYSRLIEVPFGTSDILAAYWLRNPNPRNLKYWFGQDVTNKDTVPVITKILVDHGHTGGVPA